MATHRVDSLDGEGEIFRRSGPRICRVRYTLGVWQNTTDIGHGRTHAGLTEIIGRVELLHCSYALLRQRASEGPRQSTGLELQLGDGRWVNVAITSPDGTVTALGTIRGTR
jgi:hypothetical protein